jgi:hypothetical protein
VSHPVRIGCCLQQPCPPHEVGPLRNVCLFLLAFPRSWFETSSRKHAFLFCLDGNPLPMDGQIFTTQRHALPGLQTHVLPFFRCVEYIINVFKDAVSTHHAGPPVFPAFFPRRMPAQGWKQHTGGQS